MDVPVKNSRANIAQIPERGPHIKRMPERVATIGGHILKSCNCFQPGILFNSLFY